MYTISEYCYHHIHNIHWLISTGLFWSVFHSYTQSFHVSHAAKANMKWAIDEWCFIESVWLCDILASVPFPVEFLFDLVFSPSDTSHPSVCLCQNLLNMKQAELAQRRSAAENLPSFLYQPPSFPGLSTTISQNCLACEKMSWSGIFGVNSRGLIWSFFWKHIDWLKLSL